MIQVAFNIGKPVDVIDHIIKFFTGSKCYHCELVFSNGESFSADPKSNGTRFKQVDYSNKSKWELISLPWISEDQEKIIRQFCNNELGCKYDWFAVFFGWLITPCNSLNRWFCTEILHAAIKPFCRYLHDRWYNPEQLRQEIKAEVFWQDKFKDLNR